MTWALTFFLGLTALAQLSLQQAMKPARGTRITSWSLTKNSN
jgi:hypothetical protein